MPAEIPDGALLRGRNNFSIRVGPLFLSRRRFNLVVLISSNGGKFPLDLIEGPAWL